MMEYSTTVIIFFKYVTMLFGINGPCDWLTDPHFQQNSTDPSHIPDILLWDAFPKS